MPNTDINTYGVRDLYNSVACLLSGCHLKEITEFNQGHFIFIFSNPPSECEKAIFDYYSGKLSASVKDTVNAIFFLKKVMNDFKREKEK